MALSYSPSLPVLASACHGIHPEADQPSRARKSSSYTANLKGIVGVGLSSLRGARKCSAPADKGASTPDIELQKDLRRGRILCAATYPEYCHASAELDQLEQAEEWRAHDETDLYDYQLMRQKVRELEHALDAGNADRMLELLRRCTAKNFAGMNKAGLYSRARLGTKHLIDRYVNVVRDIVAAILRDIETADRTRSERILTTLTATRRQCGRTALLLSGGGTLGMNHIGVIKALYETKLLPRVISGTSAGSIVASILCSRPDADLPVVLDQFLHGDLAVFVGPDEDLGHIARLKYFAAHHHLYDVSNLARVMRHWLGDLTFAEAHKLSNRILNIAVTSTGTSRGPLLLNAFSTPHVVIRSAVVASCSVPLIFQPASLECKDPNTGKIEPYHKGETFLDGSLQGDIPVRDVSDQLGCDTFIVSQVNPHIRHWLSERDSDPGLAKRLYQTCSGLVWAEIRHHMGYAEALLSRAYFLSDWRCIADQPYTGNINIWPSIERQHVLGVLSNPTPEFMQYATLNGERATWKKINQIRYTTAIERIFQDAIDTIRERLGVGQRPAHLRTQSFTLRPATRPVRTHTLGEARPSARTASDDALATPEKLAARIDRAMQAKAILRPITPDKPSRRSTDSPTTPRARSPAPNPADLLMTPTTTTPSSPVRRRSAVAADHHPYRHRRIQSDLALSASLRTPDGSTLTLHLNATQTQPSKPTKPHAERETSLDAPTHRSRMPRAPRQSACASGAGVAPAVQRRRDRSRSRSRSRLRQPGRV